MYWAFLDFLYGHTACLAAAAGILVSTRFILSKFNWGIIGLVLLMCVTLMSVFIVRVNTTFRTPCNTFSSTKSFVRFGHHQLHITTTRKRIPKWRFPLHSSWLKFLKGIIGKWWYPKNMFYIRSMVCSWTLEGFTIWRIISFISKISVNFIVTYFSPSYDSVRPR